MTAARKSCGLYGGECASSQDSAPPLSVLTGAHPSDSLMPTAYLHVPMKRIQLGGVFVKNPVIPKLTGPARYRGTKRVERPKSSTKLGGTASQQRSSSQSDEERCAMEGATTPCWT